MSGSDRVPRVKRGYGGAFDVRARWIGYYDSVPTPASCYLSGSGSPPLLQQWIDRLDRCETTQFILRKDIGVIGVSR